MVDFLFIYNNCADAGDDIELVVQDEASTERDNEVQCQFYINY